MLCMFYGSVPIFIGWGEGLRVEQRGPVREAKNLEEETCVPANWPSSSVTILFHCSLQRSLG
jgi:hypothetical protein